MIEFSQGHGVRWYALYVKPRHEKNVSNALRGKGYEPFVPLYQSKRTHLCELPLFPCYVFTRLDARERLPVLKIPSVFFMVGMGKVPVPLEESEIAALKTIVASGSSVQPWPYMKAGDRVRIQDGPLRGVEGFFEKADSTMQLIVSVTLLRRSVAVRIDARWAVPIEEETELAMTARTG